MLTIVWYLGLVFLTLGMHVPMWLFIALLFVPQLLFRPRPS